MDKRQVGNGDLIGPQRPRQISAAEKQQIVKELAAVLAAHDCALLPVVRIVGNRVISSVQIVPKAEVPNDES